MSKNSERMLRRQNLSLNALKAEGFINKLKYYIKACKSS